MIELARSAGTEPVFTLTGSRKAPDPKYFIGTGKLEELKSCVRQYDADAVLFNHALTPSQERNLETALGVRTVDRNGLILDIFAQRAQSFEGKLQVELAQLQHLSTRLVRGWTHLERQKGGIGLRGPGETQLETDRRLLNLRMKQIRKRLERVDKHRHQGRAQRKKAEVPTVALVGYTNAGKSTLFNALTGADAYAADQLFATLDPTLRACALADGRQVVLADTVGFIRHLPHELVAAFKSTLQEAGEADLLLHVVDGHAQDRDDTAAAVNRVLADIGAGDVRQLQVINKIDLLADAGPRLDRGENGDPARVWISAQARQGLDFLVRAMTEMVSAATRRLITCRLAPDQGNLRAALFAHAKILEERVAEDGSNELRILIDQKYLGLLKSAVCVEN